LPHDLRDAALISPWLAEGWATRTPSHLVLTAQGWLRLDTLAADLTYARSRS